MSVLFYVFSKYSIQFFQPFFGLLCIFRVVTILVIQFHTDDFNHRLSQALISSASYHLPKCHQSVYQRRWLWEWLQASCWLESHSFAAAAPWPVTWPDPEQVLFLSVNGFHHTACSDSKSIVRQEIGLPERAIAQPPKRISSQKKREKQSRTNIPSSIGT
jgi:hypothetical protein